MVNHLHHLDLSDSFPPTREQTTAIAAAISHVLHALHDHPETAVGSRNRRFAPESGGALFEGRVRADPKGAALGRDQGCGVPAVALTAYARAEDRMKALASGFQMHVAKPVEPGELVMVVASLAGRVHA